MADATTTTADQVTDEAATLVKTIEALEEGLKTANESITELSKTIEEKSKTVVPWMSGAPGVSVGESINGSRNFNFARLAKGLTMKKNNLDPSEECKLELEYCERLAKSSAANGAKIDGTHVVPIGSDYLDGDMDTELVKEWQQMNNNLMAKLSRYEGHILAQLKSVHAQFLQEQARRLDREAAKTVIPATSPLRPCTPSPRPCTPSPRSCTPHPAPLRRQGPIAL